MIKKNKEKVKINFNKQENKEDQSLVSHIKLLGLKSIDEYVRWCSDHNFSTGLYKSESLRSKEVSFLRSQVLEYNLIKNSKLNAPLNIQINNYFKEKDKIILEHPYIKTEIKKNYNGSFEYKHSTTKDSSEFEDFLKYTFLIDKKTKLLQTEWFYSTIKMIYLYKAYWIRDVNDWSCEERNTEQQLSSLLKFLFAKYSYPDFLNNVWGEDNHLDIDFFLWIVSGNNIRNHPKLPIKLTKNMANYFLLAPEDSNIYKAIRYGQILSMGGDKRLVDMVCETRLGREFLNNEFWCTVIVFFIKNPMLDRNMVQPIIDYIHYQKFVDGKNALQPNFEMKGRNPEILLQDVQAWHRELRKLNNANKKDWKPSGIDSYYKEVTSGESKIIWQVKELLTTRELQKEGAEQRHCVSSYANSCAYGQCAIFSIRKNNQILGTIEVIPKSKVIVQARGKCNTLLKGKAWDLLVSWSNMIGFKITCSSGN